MHRYILCVIDVFSKYLHLVPVKTKSGPHIASAFRSIFHHDDSLRPVWVRIDNGKEFLNKQFQDMLRHETFLLKVCKNPDVKCAVVEHAHRMIRNRLYNYFTYKNTYRYIDVLPKFVQAYNDRVNSTTGMAPSRVTDANVPAK
jgi:transposase InsO family protein